MKFVTWNVNGLRACITKGLPEYLKEINADIVALQETKINNPLPEAVPPGYEAVWSCGERAGYSGVACMFKTPPLSVSDGIGDSCLNKEGRIITLEYPTFYFINVYVPNSQGELDRWYYRLEWDAAFADYLELLILDTKPIIVAGDFNVARDYIDVYPENIRNIENPPGFRSEERDGLNTLLDLGFIDVFRELHPTERAYSWWSNRLNKRDEDRGWRIDYFLVSNKLLRKIKSCKIRADISGSDHAPIELAVKL